MPTATVEMAEFTFTPADLRVPRDARVTIVNRGTVPHSWVLTGPGRGTPEVAAGASRSLDLGGIAPGTYRVICDQVGHAAAGQVGSVTIAP